MKREWRCGGYLLLDAVLTLFIVSVALLAIAGVFLQTTKANTAASRRTVAAGLAQQQMENLKQQPDAFWDVHNNSSETQVQTGPQGENYTMRTDYAVAEDTDKGKLIQATVTVSWKEAGSNPSVQLVTYYLWKAKVPQY
ncbi:Hypothetical protein LUCI_2112 [Lucifera butyrica]|uniref:Type iv pilin n-term methylation site gfxxxe n=1 Tax=Lucifera butyrica TaxID=1351585 RepID=A0A498R7B4_9FIRM|nr:hypothetical protein [Lucifera butyrica]VBB06875.1 Hypothetical protein LUCI_2112 [Lucifera butyrica]